MHFQASLLELWFLLDTEPIISRLMIDIIVSNFYVHQNNNT